MRAGQALWGVALGALSCFLAGNARAAEDSSRQPDADQMKAQFESVPADRDLTLRHFNFQTSPMGLLAHRYNASADVGVTDSLALGIKGTSYPHSVFSGVFNTSSGYEVGARATYYATGNRYEDGIILRPGVYYGNWNTIDDANPGSMIANAFVQALGGEALDHVDRVKGPVGELLGGYQMVLRSGINFDWNAGLTFYREEHFLVGRTTGSEKEDSPASLQISPLLEFNVGYSF